MSGSVGRVRDSLTKLLDRYGAPRIITELADIAACVPALAAPNRRATQTVLAARRRAVRELRNALNRPDDPADTMLESELTYRGRDPEKTVETLREVLAVLDAALGAIDRRLADRRGGRPANSQARYLIEETRRVLAGAGAPVSDYEDGVLAKTLRILWPVVLEREDPNELRHWFKSLKIRR
jgi:hypothetical protein